MKKIVISLMLVGLLLVGCGKKNKDLDLDRITASIEETNLFKDASKIDIDYIERKYGMSTEGIEDYRIYMSKTSTSASMYAIFKVSSDKAKENIESTFINKYINSWTEIVYNASEAKLDENMYKEEYSGYIIYIVSTDNDKVLNIINYVLLVFSLIFYAWGEPVYIILMIFSCLLNYFYALYHDKVKNKKLLFILCIVANLLILGFFKYADFLIDIINSIFRLNINPLKLALPIGISFFTFQTMSYSIDVYRSSVVPERNFFYFTTYVSMFPQLIAGPIVRYETISKEILILIILVMDYLDLCKAYLKRF